MVPSNVKRVVAFSCDKVAVENPMWQSCCAATMFAVVFFLKKSAATAAIGKSQDTGGLQESRAARKT